MNPKHPHVVELDVRPSLRKKLEPFQLIMDKVKGLGEDDMFVLHATFKPTPLFGVLKMKGLAGKAEQVGEEHWICTFVNKKNKQWLHELAVEEDAPPAAASCAIDGAPAGNGPVTVTLDNRGLEPPKPMMRTLAALGRCRAGDALIIHNDRVPLFLIEELCRMGCPYTVENQSDGSAKVTIRKG